MNHWISRQFAVRWQVITICLVLCGLFWLTSPVQAKSYYHPRIDQTVKIEADGSATVDEVRTFLFSGEFTFAYLRLRTTGQYGDYLLEYQGVWDADTKKELKWTQKREKDEEVLTWYYDARNEVKRFHIRYRIRYAVQCYSDVAQFYWKVIEDSHEKIDSLHTTLILPEPSPAFFKLYVHSKARPGSLEFSTGMDSVFVKMGKIPTKSFVELRALFEPGILTNPNIRIGEDRASLLENEYQIFHPGFWERVQRLTPILTQIIPFFAIGLLYWWFWATYGSEPKVQYDREYERDAPRDLPPAVVSAIMSQGDIDIKMVAHGFSATLLEAGRLGYLTIEVKPDGEEGGITYRLTPKGEQLLKGYPVERKSGERAFEEFEVDVLKAVFREAGNMDSATQMDIKIWAEEMIGGSSRFRNFVQSWGLQMRGWFEQKYFAIDVKASEEAKDVIKFVSGLIVFALFVWMNYFGGNLFIVLTIAATVIMGILGSRYMSRRTPQAALEVTRWNAFKKFLTDFSALEEARANLLPMWEKYLVWAAALGVAPKLIMNLSTVVQSERGDNSFSSDWMFYSTGRASLSHSFHLAGLTTITDQLSGMTDTLVSTFSMGDGGGGSDGGDFSSSGGGGGFSIGGGGGGGGGRSGAG